MTATRVEWNHEAEEFALNIARAGSLELMDCYFDAPMPAISGALRSLFTAAPGHDLVCSDYSSIEAVVLAEIAGEEWRREVFRTHGRIYEVSAARITGIPFDPSSKERHPKRKLGKVAELASGYGGFIGSWKAFGASEFMNDEEIKQAVLAWRSASPRIVALWGGQRDGFSGIEGAAIRAVQAPGSEYDYRGISFVVERGVLMMRLLSGRRIAYHAPELKPSTRRYGELSLSFMGWNTNPKNGAKGWVRMDTYGPRLVENIVQATARDIQRHGIVNLERAGYPIVLHVYDENVAEVKEGVGSVEEFESIMSAMPPWCADWPVLARGGWRGKRYRK